MSRADLFQRADHLVPSPYSGHLPFLFLLLAELAPAEVLTLGLHDGVAHFAACQVARIRFATMQGDPQGPAQMRCRGLRLQTATPAETETVQAETLDLYGRSLHPQGSAILAVTPETAPERIENGSIGLLFLEQTAGLIDSNDLIEGFAHDWVPKLRPDAIILVPGTPAGAEWIGRLCARYPHLVLPHHGGLTALAPGGQPPALLQRLAPEGALSPPVQRLLESAGRLHLQDLDLRETGKVLQETLRKARGDQSWARRLQTERQEIDSAYDARHRAAACAQADLADCRQALTSLHRQHEDEQAHRFEEIAALTRRIEEQTTEIARRDAALGRLRAEISALRSSTSWKVTAPARAIILRLRR